jgi:hypothetical protein
MKLDRWPGVVILPAGIFDYARSMGIDMLRYRRAPTKKKNPTIPTSGAITATTRAGRTKNV